MTNAFLLDERWARHATSVVLATVGSLVARTPGPVPAAFGPGWLRDRTPTASSRLKLALRFSVRGRARLLAHLECVGVVLGALRRADAVAWSNGMPEPAISLATSEIVGSPDPEPPARRPTRARPRAIAAHHTTPSSARPRLVGCCQLLCETPPDEIETATAAYPAPPEIVVERRSPKGCRALHAKRCAPLAEVDGGITADVALTSEGSLRPEGLPRALERASATDLAVRTISRLTLRVAPLVGAPTIASGETL